MGNNYFLDIFKKMSRSAVNKTEASYGNDSQNLLESGR